MVERVVARFFDDFTQEAVSLSSLPLRMTFIDASVAEAQFHYPPDYSFQSHFNFSFPNNSGRTHHHLDIHIVRDNDHWECLPDVPECQFPRGDDGVENEI
jgi:hypothetical protein